MRFSTLIILILLGTLMRAQDITHIGCHRIQGYIIPEDVQLFPEPNRFTPSIEDIFKAEKILRQGIRRGKCNNLPIKMIRNNYISQYVGYYDGNDNKEILMIFTKKGIISDKSRFKGFINILDGDNNHWRITVNIDNGQIKDLIVNGPG